MNTHQKLTSGRSTKKTTNLARVLFFKNYLKTQAYLTTPLLSQAT